MLFVEGGADYYLGHGLKAVALTGVVGMGSVLMDRSWILEPLLAMQNISSGIMSNIYTCD
jgi:hypothetical protein